ncbi:HAD-IIB family hydrolase [Mesorhizobium caraganae]|uniref:HAD-IIB family hydrolase n=1 Tax=Mesorhizobium caraganae TaxID=483206 RepID=A0ABV1Z6Z3_9HYPH
MRPLADFTTLDRRKIAVVLTDIDDTLTDRGRLPAKAYAALERLKQAGFIVAPVTGRPAGWCDLIARQWPVDGVIGENGAFYFRYDDAAKRIVRHYAKSAAERQADAARLREIEQTVLREVPGAAVAADQPYREADLAIDFCEDVAPLPRTEVLKVVGIFQRYGATAKISSIHVNGWFGKYDKLSTSRLFLQDCFGIDIDHDKDSIAFVGDSPNDAPMFGFFPNSVGVANVLDFAGELPASPAFVTSGRGAQGFAELADALIAAKGMEVSWIKAD